MLSNATISSNHLGLPDYAVPDALQRQIDQMVADKKDISKSDAQDREEAARQHEMSCEAVKHLRWESQDELAKIRLGRILSENEFLRLLRKINQGFWYNDYVIRGFRGLNIEQGNVGSLYCGAVQAGFMPEFSTLRIDNHGLVTREAYRGWRSVLLKLYDLKVITEAQADRVFGKAAGPGATQYLKDAQRKRNASGLS